MSFAFFCKNGILYFVCRKSILAKMIVMFSKLENREEIRMKKEDCLFCKIANGEIPSTTIYENNDFRVIFDIAPASKGHALIIPKQHYNDIFDMDAETGGKLFSLATAVARALKKELNCEGMNIVQNNGLIAGQTVFHFHLHLIPRYAGDTVNIGWIPGEANQVELAELAKAVRKAI